MGWRDLFRDLGKLRSETKDKRRKEEQELRKREEEVAKHYGPRVERVCKEFCRQTKWRASVLSNKTEFHFYRSAPPLFCNAELVLKIRIGTSAIIISGATGSYIVAEIPFNEFTEYSLAKILRDYFINSGSI